jgi:L-fuculose-phosphate aldolase
MYDIRLRHGLINTALLLTRSGLNTGTAGNLSVRNGEGFLVTPSGVAAEALVPRDLVYMDFDGLVDGERAPSSEWRFHREILATRPDIGAVVHTHAPYCTTLAVLGRSIPAFHYMVAVAGGTDIRCAPYATFGSQALCDGAVAALEGRRACLLAQHGMIAAGATLDAAFKLAVEVEDLARLYWQALQIGEPPILDDAEMDRVLEKFRTYGSPQPALLADQDIR